MLKMDNKKNMKRLEKKKFDEEKMSEECGELVQSKSLNKCKPKGVGVFCQSDGPPAAGGGIGMSFWFKDWHETYQFLADYFVAFAPGPSNSDHATVYAKIWEIINELAQSKIHREQALKLINNAASSYSQIEWWGTFDDLCEGLGEFEMKVRQNCLRDSDGKSFTEKIGTSEKKNFMDAITNYGF
jgi:hypothetical protein